MRTTKPKPKPKPLAFLIAIPLGIGEGFANFKLFLPADGEEAEKCLQSAFVHDNHT